MTEENLLSFSTLLIKSTYDQNIISRLLPNFCVQKYPTLSLVQALIWITGQLQYFLFKWQKHFLNYSVQVQLLPQLQCLD